MGKKHASQYANFGSLHIEVNNSKNKNVIAGLINYYRQQQSCGKRKKQNVAKPRLPDETT